MSSASYFETYPIQQLRRVGLSDARAKELSTKTKIHSFEVNQVICAKGAQFDNWYLIISGFVAASMPTSHAAYLPISLYGENSWFGEQSIISKKPSYADYVCLLPTEALSVPAALVQELLESEPYFAKYAAELMAWRAQKTTEMLMLMKLGNPYLRVVMGIAQFVEELSCKSERPPTIGYGSTTVEVPLNQTALAALCGVARTTFSEVLQKLESGGWIKIAYGKLEIPGQEVWHRFSQKQRARNMNNLNPTMDELLHDLKQSDML
jgi:CRP-like cAMP-binding protein